MYGEPKFRCYSSFAELASACPPPLAFEEVLDRLKREAAKAVGVPQRFFQPVAFCDRKTAIELQAMLDRYYDKYYAPGITPEKRRRMLALVWQKQTKPLPLP